MRVCSEIAVERKKGVKRSGKRFCYENKSDFAIEFLFENGKNLLKR